MIIIIFSELISRIDFHESLYDNWIILNKTNLFFSFSQHIPIKIEKLNENENNLGSNVQYGGGEFQILISREI